MAQPPHPRTGAAAVSELTRNQEIPALALVLAGCSTVGSRIREHADEYSRLDPATQAKIKEGVVDVGFSPDMVYMALGNPDTKRHCATRDSTTETWIYRTYYQTYEGTALVSYRPWYRHDPFHHRYHVYWGPAFSDVYRTHREDKIRIAFRDGKVVSIDQRAS